MNLFTEDKENAEKYVALDCEMVGVGKEGEKSVLARISVVNYNGAILLDEIVRPKEFVTDFRTGVSGVKPSDIRNGESLENIQKKLDLLVKGKFLVGHALQNDFKVLFMSHPKKKIRDTSRCKEFRKLSKGASPSLKMLASQVLGLNIQEGAHSSVQDAQVAMLLYRSVKLKWEVELKPKIKSKHSNEK